MTARFGRFGHPGDGRAQSARLRWQTAAVWLGP